MSAVSQTNDFMNSLRAKWVDKGTAATSADAYLKSLLVLNGKRAFSSLGFLKKQEDVKSLLESYAPTTRRNMVTAILSATKLSQAPMYKKLYKDYTALFETFNKTVQEQKEERGNGKTEKEEENWVEWGDIVQKRQELEGEVRKFPSSLTKSQYDTLLSYIVLCLYTMQPPRRNKDYTEAYIYHGKVPEDAPKDRNYVEMVGGTPTRFMFNVFKTAKHMGSQEQEIDDDLAEAIELYHRWHPLMKSKGRKAKMHRFLVTADGSPLNGVNGMTRVLNKIFKKKIGSSMLRHIYLSSKYDADEMAEDAKEMAHSMSQQRDYLRV